MREFLQSTYEAAAELGHWNHQRLNHDKAQTRPDWAARQVRESTQPTIHELHELVDLELCRGRASAATRPTPHARSAVHGRSRSEGSPFVVLPRPCPVASPTGITPRG
ncbi:hypothetical protein K1T34_01400 [Amycolatopsis sp. DSM 110486]|nr:hypothetical protein K1T34_01400 [Amycolatopsis sp. DSM 110486]